MLYRITAFSVLPDESSLRLCAAPYRHNKRSCPTPTQDSTASASTRSVLARASSPAGTVCADSQAPALPVSLFAVRIGSLYSPAADSPAASAGSRGTQAAQTDRNSQEQTRKHAPAPISVRSRSSKTLLIQISDRLISNQRANHSCFPPLPFQQNDCLLIIKRMRHIFRRIA